MNNGPVQHFHFKISIYFFVCTCMCPGEYTTQHTYRGWEVRLFLPPCVFGGLNSGHQAWWQVPSLPDKPSL